MDSHPTIVNSDRYDNSQDVNDAQVVFGSVKASADKNVQIINHVLRVT